MKSTQNKILSDQIIQKKILSLLGTLVHLSKNYLVSSNHKISSNKTLNGNLVLKILNPFLNSLSKIVKMRKMYYLNVYHKLVLKFHKKDVANV